MFTASYSPQLIRHINQLFRNRQERKMNLDAGNEFQRLSQKLKEDVQVRYHKSHFTKNSTTTKNLWNYDGQDIIQVTNKITRLSAKKHLQNFHYFVPNTFPPLPLSTRMTVSSFLRQLNSGNLLIVSHGSPIAMVHEVLTGEWHYVGQCTISKFVSTQNGLYRAVIRGDSSHLSDRTNLRDREIQRPIL